MIEKWMRLVSGTATVRVTGDTARFLSILMRSGLSPLEVTAEADAVRLVIHARQYKNLHAVKRRTHVKVRLLKKSGLPFFLRRVLRRPGIPVGVALGVCLYIWLSGFYWCVEMTGEAPYARSEILAAAKESGVFLGVRKKAVDLPVAANRVLYRLPELAWASFNSDGCTVTLEYRAAEEKAEGIDHSGAVDIVAARDGLVKSITAQSGKVLVQTGAAVLKGQVLVSGVTVIGEPWYTEEKHLLSHARAQIIAETRHTFTARCPLQTEGVRETPIGVRRELYVLGLRIPLSLNGARDGDAAETDRKQLKILGKALPVWVDTQRCTENETVTVTFTEAEATRRAQEKVRQLQENYLAQGGRILSEETEILRKNGSIYVSAHCVLEEDIAQEIALDGS